MRVLRLLIPSMLFIQCVWAQGDLRDEVLSKLTYLIENPAHGYPSKEWMEKYVSIRDTQDDIKPILINILEKDDPSLADYAVFFLQKRGEIDAPEAQKIMGYSDRLFSELPKVQTDDEQGLLTARISKNFNALEDSDLTSLPEDFFYKYALSGNEQLTAGAFKMMLKHGSEKSIPIMRQALQLIERDNLRQRLEQQYLQPLMTEHPGAIDEPIAENPAIAPEVEEGAQEPTASEPAPEKPLEVKTPEPSEEPAEEPPQWWLWLIGAVVIVGGIGLIARRKN